MKTNNIKSFAKKARLILLDGVAFQLKYWGFDENGTVGSAVTPTVGGYAFRGQIFNDAGVPAKWNRLKSRMTSKQAVEDVKEEAAYTWFNRLMAIKILEMNRYIPETLAFTGGTRTPAILQKAKRGEHDISQKEEARLLNECLMDNRDEQALAMLLINYCHNNRLLNNVFGRIDDFTEILLPQNMMQKDGLLDLINSGMIDAADFKEVELIGWLYQFYISDKKDKIFADFKNNKKARAEDIPAATQIFTPKWVVKYMVENTVGKIYLDYEPSSSLRVEMKYLVETHPGTKQDAELVEASGSKQPLNLFSEHPSTGTEPAEAPLISDITQLTLLDPASGSGHILVTGFDLLFKMYREAGYSSRQAVENILKNNLFGLEIDDRAMQLARFAVLLKAAQYDAGILNRDIIPHVYSFPEADHFSTEELHTFLGHAGLAYTAELKDALNLMNQGKNIGSALKLQLSESCKAHLLKTFKQWTEKAASLSLDIEKLGIWYRLKPFLEVLLLKTRRFKSVAANPPYLTEKNMNNELRQYVKTYYKKSASDLSMIFMEVISDFSLTKGYLSIINQWSWLCTDDFISLREWFLNTFHIKSELFLGIGVFPELNSKKVQSVAIVFQNEMSNSDSIFIKLDEVFNARWKENNFFNPKLKYSKNQKDFQRIEGYPFTFWFNENSYQLFDDNKYLGNILDPRQGMATTDNKRFLRSWHEVPYYKIGFNLSHLEYLRSNSKYIPYNKGGGYRKWYGNNEFVIEYTNDGADLLALVTTKYPKISDPEFVIKNRSYYFKKSITWGLIALRFTARFSPQGFIFDVGGSSGFPPDEEFEYILGLLNSKISSYYLQGLNYTLNIQVGDIKRVAFKKGEQKYCSEIIKSVNQGVVISRRDWDSRETSWDFEKSPLLNEGKSLNEAYHQWQQEAGNDFFQLHANEEELNRIFIEIYGLQDELTPEVALKDITILQEELDRGKLEELEPLFREKGKDAVALPIKKDEVISQFISYCIGVMMGRYRLDKPGLNIAHPNLTEEELAAYTHNGHSITIDEDAILPLMGEDCSFADDALVQFKHLLLAIWGEETLTANINFIQECLRKSPHQWITEDFWGYHTCMYKKKPIYWLFTSNSKRPGKAAFKVLVYMHCMNRFTVQQIQRRYLHPHQEYIKREILKLRENEGSLNKHELKRLEMLQNWEVECRSYNEVLKELANLQIEFDLDDGVSVNYEKFKGAVAEI